MWVCGVGFETWKPLSTMDALMKGCACGCGSIATTRQPYEAASMVNHPTCAPTSTTSGGNPVFGSGWHPFSPPRSSWTSSEPEGFMIPVSRAEFERYPGFALSVGSANQNGLKVVVRVMCIDSMVLTTAEKLG